MRRRFAIAIIGTVLASLVVAGIGTLVLAGVGARRQTATNLRDQARATAAILDANPRATQDTPASRAIRFERVRNALDIDDISLVVLRPNDQIGTELSDPLPDGLTAERLDPDRLRAGDATSGALGRQVWAAAPIGDTQGVLGVVVLTRPVDRALGPAVGWFLLASAVAIAIAAIVATRLAKQLTRPLREATDATARIAAGDLSVRLPENRRPDDEVGTLSREINQMAVTLERSRGLEQQFLLSISHDLRTPLTSIHGFAEAVADGTAPDAVAAAEVILAESRRLERLVKDLLDLAKLEAREFRLELVTVDVVEVVRRAAAGFEREAADAGLTIAVETPVQPAVLTGDPDRLGQVLANLIENALKFASTNVAVTVEHDGASVQIIVSDDGPGIAPEDLPHVFDRLYVSRSPSVRTESGSGLGLAIARELVAAMGGQIVAEANAPQGTRVVVRF
jgi:two-component system sensor histidine kinase BaeS